MVPDKKELAVEEGPVRMRVLDLTLWRECQQEAKRRGIVWRNFVEQALREHMRKKT